MLYKIFYCTCVKAKFPKIAFKVEVLSFILPKLTCVESLDASVISKFPLRPNKAGTRV